MSFSIGNHIKYTIFGESHGFGIGMCIDGLPAGVKINHELINFNLARRKPNSKFNTKRLEKDELIWVSGITNNTTNGGNLCFFIENENVKSSDYNEFKACPRPAHSDYPAYIKYRGFNDLSGGGFFSARLTASIVVAGSIIQSILEQAKISIHSYVNSVGEMTFTKSDYSFDRADISSIKYDIFELNSDKKQALEQYLSKNATDDALGGKVKLFCNNIPIGIGEPYFNSIESVLSHYLFSIPALKAISFGDAQTLCKDKASETMEELRIDEFGNIQYQTNYNGGILGGLSNGMPIEFELCFRPASSIPKSVKTVNLCSGKNVNLKINGRHDSAFVLRVPVICEAMSYMAIYDLLLSNNKRSVI